MLIMLMALEDPGDRALLTRLYEDHARMMLREACGILENRADAEDAVHDVFVRLMDMPDRLRQIPGEEEKTFLLVCIRNRARDILRMKSRRREVEWDPELLKDSPAEEEEGDGIARLKGAIAELDPGMQEILLLHYHYGMTYEEIGRLRKKSGAAIQKTVSRLRQELKEMLGGESA